MVKMEVAGSGRCVIPEALRMEKVGRAVDTTVTVELERGAGRSTGTTLPFNTDHHLKESRREILDGIDGQDLRVCVELERCGWRREIKVAETVCILGVHGIVIGLDDANESGFGDVHGLLMF